MNIQGELENFISQIESSKNNALCDLCLCLIDLKRVKKSIYSLDENRLNRAIAYAQQIKRSDLVTFLQLLQALSTLKNS